MKLTSTICVLIIFVLIQESVSLTMLSLFHKLKQRQRSAGLYPDEALADDVATSMTMSEALRKTYVRPIGSVAGRPIIPRRWTTNQRIDDVFVDENGVAYPVRTYNPFNNLRGGRSGIY